MEEPNKTWLAAFLRELRKLVSALGAPAEVIRETIKETIKEIVISPEGEPIGTEGQHYLPPTAIAANNTEEVWAPNSAYCILLKEYSVSVDSATELSLRWGTTPFKTWFLPTNGSIEKNLIGCNLKGPKGVKLFVHTVSAATVTVTACGKEVAP